MRKSLREKSRDQKINYADEMARIENILSNDGILQYYKNDDYMCLLPQYTSIISFFDVGYFINYPYSENYISFTDMRNSFGFSKKDITKNDINMMLDYFECVYNLISFLFNQYRSGRLNLTITNEAFIDKILKNISSVLAKLNYEMILDEGYYYIIEKDASSSAVTELYPDISDRVLEYKRHQLKGDTVRKSEILSTLAKKFEAIRPRLKANNFYEIEDKAGSLLNNLDIRHNGKEGQNAKDIVVKMSNEELEDWYDKTYDLLLTSFMLNHYLDYREEIKDLNQKLKNKV